MNDEEFQKALERAMKLLAVRARSRRELSDRLVRLEFGPVAVEQVVTRLTDLGLVDDSEFALERVRHLLSKGQSVRSMKQDLASSGISEEIIESSLQTMEPDESELERALELARKRAESCTNLPANKAFGRVARYLCSKGYGADVAAEACREALRDRNDT